MSLKRKINLIFKECEHLEIKIKKLKLQQNLTILKTEKILKDFRDKKKLKLKKKGNRNNPLKNQESERD